MDTFLRITFAFSRRNKKKEIGKCCILLRNVLTILGLENKEIFEKKTQD